MTAYPRLLPCGDSAVLIEFGDDISQATNARVAAFTAAVRAAQLAGIVQVIPAYASALVEYEPLIWPSDTITRHLQSLLPKPDDEAPTRPAGRLIRIPILYDGEDLPAVAAHTGLSPEDIIARHSEAHYTVYATGFSPGFAFLGGLPPELATPRLTTPRTIVPAGSVAIGGAQTGIYPRPSPGGWRLLGRTYVPLFDSDRPDPALLRTGDRVRFIPISVAAYTEAATRLAGGAVS